MKNDLLTYKSAQLEQSQFENRHLATLAAELLRSRSTEQTREIIVRVCQSALAADAICLYAVQPRGYYEMIAERGCTPEFKHKWYRLYPEKVPLIAKKEFEEPLFYGSAEEFKREFPNSEQVVDQSARKAIAYAPLVIGKKAIGILGFSYNIARALPRKDFVVALVTLCAEALERDDVLKAERRAQRQSDEANQAKTAFLSNISHEIRAPISTIIGFADLISGAQTLPPNIKNWVQRITQNARHLSSLIGDVLDISKIEANKVEVCRHVFSLREFLEDVKAVTLFKAEERGVALTFKNNSKNLDIFTDAIHLRQILINLIGNAIKFTPRGGCIEVRVEHSRCKLHVEVEDSGIGIAAENRKRIFEPFVQLDGGDSSIGTGLGLSIAKKYATALDGDIVLKQSEPGHGSTFAVEVACEGCPERARQNIEPKAAPKNQLEGLKLLVVDDSIDNQIVVKCFLTDEGADVDTADNGRVGIEKAISSDYDVIVMDIQMPELDGNQAVSLLRSRGYKKPIVALTAEVLAVQKEEGLQRGFDEYLTKPINRDWLIHTLSRLTNDAHRERVV